VLGPLPGVVMSIGPKLAINATLSPTGMPL
jgi:hypothetical protein